MDFAIHTPSSFTTLTQANRFAFCTECAVTALAIFYAKAIHARCLSAFAVQHGAAIVAKKLVAFVTERIFTFNANIIIAVIAGVALLPPVHTVFERIHPQRVSEVYIAFAT